MYLSPSDLQRTRLASLDNLHGASLSGVETTEKLAELALRAGRQALAEGRQHLESLSAGTERGSVALPLERLTAWRGESAELVREYFEIIGDAHQAILKMARDQVAVLDEAFMKQMAHAARSVDANGEAAIGHVRNVVRQAEAGFNELADAASRGTELVEEQVRQVSAALGSGEILDAEEADEADGNDADAPLRKRAPRSK